MFGMLLNDYTQSRTSYSNTQAIGAENKGIAQQYAARLIDTLEARTSSREGK